MSLPLGFEADLQMPELASILSNLARVKIIEEKEFGIKLELENTNGSASQDWIAQRCLKAARELNLSMRSPSKSLSLSNVGESTAIYLQGPIGQLENFYNGIPRMLNTTSASFERLSDETQSAPVLKFSFKSSSQDARTGSLLISLMNASAFKKGAFSSLLTTVGERSSENFKTLNSLGLSEKPSPNILQQGKPNYNLPHLNASLASIHQTILEKRLRTKEWQNSFRSDAFDHSSYNLRFNYSSNYLMQDNINQRPETSPSSTHHLSASASHHRFLSTVSSGDSPLSGASPLDQLMSRGQHIVSVEGIDWRQVGSKDLCNLFTNYGNIELAICCSSGDGFYLCYFSRQGVEFAVSCLNGMNLEGDIVSVKSISKAFLQSQLLSKKYSYFAPRKRFSSKGPGLPNKVNPISRTLHVTYHHDRDDRLLPEDSLLQAMSHFGEIVRIKRETSAKKRNMWFVEFVDEAGAIRVVMRQHNRLFAGGTLRISFTKTI